MLTTKLRRLREFFFQLFWHVPFSQKQNRERAFDIGFSYGMLAFSVALYFCCSRPYFSPASFPSLSELMVVEGVLVQHPTKRDGRYSNEPIGIRSLETVVFKECNSFGARCLGDPARHNDWQNYLGRRARMWYRDDWMVQLEIDGEIFELYSYSHRRNFLTSVPGPIVMIFIVFAYLAFRLTKSCAKDAWDASKIKFR